MILGIAATAAGAIIAFCGGRASAAPEDMLLKGEYTIYQPAGPSAPEHIRIDDVTETEQPSGDTLWEGRMYLLVRRVTIKYEILITDEQTTAPPLSQGPYWDVYCQWQTICDGYENWGSFPVTVTGSYCWNPATCMSEFANKESLLTAIRGDGYQPQMTEAMDDVTSYNNALTAALFDDVCVAGVEPHPDLSGEIAGPPPGPGACGEVQSAIVPYAPGPCDGGPLPELPPIDQGGEGGGGENGGGTGGNGGDGGNGSGTGGGTGGNTSGAPGCTGSATDCDSDGTPDSADEDVNGDGTPNSQEDWDNDGTPNGADIDADGDGIINTSEEGGCIPGLAGCTPAPIEPEPPGPTTSGTITGTGGTSGSVVVLNQMPRCYRWNGVRWEDSTNCGSGVSWEQINMRSSGNEKHDIPEFRPSVRATLPPYPEPWDGQRRIAYANSENKALDIADSMSKSKGSTGGQIATSVTETLDVMTSDSPLAGIGAIIQGKALGYSQAISGASGGGSSQPWSITIEKPSGGRVTVFDARIFIPGSPPTREWLEPIRDYVRPLVAIACSLLAAFVLLKTVLSCAKFAMGGSR